MTSAPASFDDSTLITLALAGQAECFATLMDRHIAFVKRRIYSMVRNAHDADDLLQEVQLKVWRRLSTFRFESSFRTWIIRVAINEVLQLYRREKRRSVCQPLTDLDFLPLGTTRRTSLLLALRPPRLFAAPWPSFLQSIGKSLFFGTSMSSGSGKLLVFWN